MALTNATVDATRSWSEGQLLVIEKTLSGLTSSALVNLPTSGPTALAPRFVEFVTSTRPTDGSTIGMSWEASDTTNTEVDLRFVASDGGSLGGGKVKVLLKYLEAARQDRQSIAADNNT